MNNFMNKNRQESSFLVQFALAVKDACIFRNIAGSYFSGSAAATTDLQMRPP